MRPRRLTGQKTEVLIVPFIALWSDDSGNTEFLAYFAGPETSWRTSECL
jgi:hypothetical protein